MSVRGSAAAVSKGYNALMMSDTEKRDMVMEALEELGAQNIQEDGDEIKHSCVLPWGLHAHGDRSGSASVNWKKLAFNCFVCCGMGFFAFLAECKGESETAIRQWAEKKVDNTTEEGYTSLLRYIDQCFHPSPDMDTPIPHFNEHVLDPWIQTVDPYLTEIRHIRPENAIKHKIGYNPDIDRIIIPVFWKDKLVGWQKRRLANDGSSKYLNTPDFPRAKVLYNWEGNGLPVIVESPMSVVSKDHLDGFHFIATFGKQVTDVQLRYLTGLDLVILWFDNDGAGWDATSHVGDYLVSYTDVFVVDSPWNADAGDLDDATAMDLLEHHIVPYSLWTPPTTLKEWQR